MKAITANLLQDGRVVYLGPERQWVERLSAAALFDETAADRALKEVQGRVKEIADAYVVEATQDGAPAGRESVRETIRNNGPTVREDLGKQAEAGRHVPL